MVRVPYTKVLKLILQFLFGELCVKFCEHEKVGEGGGVVETRCGAVDENEALRNMRLPYYIPGIMRFLL